MLLRAQASILAGRNVGVAAAGAVAVGASRFRMLAMASHTGAHVCQAACELVQAIHEARADLELPEEIYAVVSDRVPVAA